MFDLSNYFASASQVRTAMTSSESSSSSDETASTSSVSSDSTPASSSSSSWVRDSEDEGDQYRNLYAPTSPKPPQRKGFFSKGEAYIISFLWLGAPHDFSEMIALGLVNYLD